MARGPERNAKGDAERGGQCGMSSNATCKGRTRAQFRSRADRPRREAGEEGATYLGAAMIREN